MPDTNSSKNSRYTFGRRVSRFFGSMDLAITSLLILAVASIVGTVLQQNQPYADYLIKFGPFWFEIFEAAGLYDVYSSLWFLSILTLLVISTSICVIRHTPSMIREMWALRTNLQEKSLQVMQNNSSWTINAHENQVVTTLMAKLVKQGFRVKNKVKRDATLISAMRGGLNRLGYILTHLAIVIICIGGLLDSNLPMKWAEWQGQIKIEVRDLPISQVPNESYLPVGKQAFQGNINISEGRYSEFAFLSMRDGYLIQSLPFRIEVKDFRIEHYDTGEPKSFETDIIIYDVNLSRPLATTISVNHPLIYGGYAIYQSSFSDGGSKLFINSWPLDIRAGHNVVPIETQVSKTIPFRWGKRQFQLEITEFRPFNINADPIAEDPGRLRNFGPSIGFKIRSETGEALEYLNYMLPVERSGREFYLSGVRSSPAEEFGYLYLPVDKEGELTGFNKFLNQIRNVKLVTDIAGKMMTETLATINSKEVDLQRSLRQTLTMLVAMFEQGGFTMVSKFIETSLPKAESETLGPAYLAMLREMLGRIYFSIPNNKDRIVDKEQLIFLQDAVDAIGSLPRYGSPVFLLLTDYEHIEASGLQVAHTPGKYIVYLGCASLITGIFLLFYLPQRRIWTIVKTQPQGVTVLVAGVSNRNSHDSHSFFKQVIYELQKFDGTLP
ncbi:MAG: cytochrome c biogenesis protein ResB [Piscirickettsiaceae bacterium]|nr:cytochrome c biogenesis protein ResB [Piscirickettsiaceae bacterium]